VTSEVNKPLYCYVILQLLCKSDPSVLVVRILECGNITINPPELSSISW